MKEGGRAVGQSDLQRQVMNKSKLSKKGPRDVVDYGLDSLVCFETRPRVKVDVTNWSLIWIGFGVKRGI